MIPDKYQILETIGRGGQGAVHKVRNKEDNTIYALKCIDISGCSSKQVQKQVRSEVNLLKKLKHPGVVRLYSAQETKYELYLQMDYINGIKLTKAVNENTLSYEYSTNIMMSLLSAMSYVHKKKVAHLDIKPDNIMLRKDGMPILVDFGCSFTLDTLKKEYKKKDNQFFTPGYVAPELLVDKDKKFDPKLADIYSLGATLYTMLTQKIVYNAVDGYTHIMSLSNGEQIEPPHIVCDNIPKEISEICMKSIQLNPSERFQSCKEFYACLANAYDAIAVKNNQVKKKRGNPGYLFRKKKEVFSDLFSSKVQELVSNNNYRVLYIMAGTILAGMSLGLFGLFYWDTNSSNEMLENSHKEKHNNETLDVKLKRFKKSIDEKKYYDEINKSSYQEVFGYLLSQAKKGDKDASFYLGKIYDLGCGKEKNLQQAKYWYEKAAVLNHVQGMVILGDMYFAGNGGVVDYDKAFEWYSKALEYKDFSVLEKLGDMYCTPKKMNYFQAKKYYKQALDHGYLGRNISDGHKSISGKIGDLYRFGSKDFEKNYRVAIEWYQRAFREGDNKILEKMGDIYFTGGYEVKKNFTKTVYWYEKAAEKGNKNVFTKVAKLYTDNGYGIQNYKKALEWYEKALKNGDTRVLLTIGTLYRDGGPGLKYNYQKALDFYNESYKEGDSGAKQNIEKLYRFVNEQSEEAALIFYNYAAKNGHKEVLKYVGDLYSDGSGSFQQDYEKAILWYIRAANEGDKSMFTKVAKLYSDKRYGIRDYKKALTWYLKAANEGDNSVFTKVAKLYYDKRYGIQDYKKALTWYIKAAEKGHKSGFAKIAKLYSDSQYKMQDYEQALRWYEKALKDGNTHVLLSMGNLYRDGGPRLERNYQRALEYYTEAVEYGDTKALARIAEFWDEKKDSKQVITWHLNTRNGKIFIKLGHLYCEGNYGIQRSYPKALRWYQQAKWVGYPGASVYVNLASERCAGAGLEERFSEIIKLTEGAKNK